MSEQLRISVGQHSDKGRKAANQDFHGLSIPAEPLLGSKGIAVALADGISSSEVGHVASESAVKSFLTDYYCTSDAWSVKRSARNVILATNAWLHAQTRHSQWRHDRDRGYVCTFSALVFKSTTAHLFHVGDTRIYRLAGNTLEQLTTDHLLLVTEDESYLSRALGVDAQIEIDYQALAVEPGDTFLLTTDGVHEYMDPAFVLACLRAHAHDLDQAARALTQEALRRGSPDNLTAQIVRIDALPAPQASELPQQAVALLPPALPGEGSAFDGYRILRQLHASHRSHLYLALDEASGQRLVIKIPSIEMREQRAYLENFLQEEWVARRIDSPHVLRHHPQDRKRNSLYITLEYLEGQSLAQWMRDHPHPDLQTVRDMIGQIAKGLQAFHRLEMLHQDLRPENVMIDPHGTLKIIDLGSVRIASLADAATAAGGVPGTIQYAAPEYFIGEEASVRSDVFSLGVIAYQLLTGRLPYGAQVPRLRTRAELHRLRYAPAREFNEHVPIWLDGALRKALHPEPFQRYEEVSEFAYDLQHPNRAFLGRRQPPLIERNPVRFWQGVSALLLVLLLAALSQNPALR